MFGESSGYEEEISESVGTSEQDITSKPKTKNKQVSHPTRFLPPRGNLVHRIRMDKDDRETLQKEILEQVNSQVQEKLSNFESVISRGMQEQFKNMAEAIGRPFQLLRSLINYIKQNKIH